MPGSWFGSDPDYPGFAGSQFRMLTQLSPGLDVQVVVFSGIIFGAAGTLSIRLKLNLGNNQAYECTVLIFQYLVQILEMAKWGDA